MQRRNCLPSKSTQGNYKNVVVCAFQEYRTALFFVIFSASWFFLKFMIILFLAFLFNEDVIWIHFWMPSWLFGLKPFAGFSHLWFVVFLFPERNQSWKLEKLKIGQIENWTNWKSDKSGNWTNWKLDKSEKWTNWKLKIGQIENQTKVKIGWIKNWTNEKIGHIENWTTWK